MTGVDTEFGYRKRAELNFISALGEVHTRLLGEMK